MNYRRGRKPWKYLGEASKHNQCKGPAAALSLLEEQEARVAGAEGARRRDGAGEGKEGTGRSWGAWWAVGRTWALNRKEV